MIDSITSWLKPMRPAESNKPTASAHFILFIFIPLIGKRKVFGIEPPIHLLLEFSNELEIFKNLEYVCHFPSYISTTDAELEKK